LYRKTVLDNGLRIVSESIPYMNSISMGFYVGTGSRSELIPEQGASHFIEHLMFKGTSQRTAREIAEMVDDVGGQLNAATDREATCYYIKMLPEHLCLGVDILSDMLRSSLFAAEDVEKERQVVLEEISLYEDSPDELIHDLHFGMTWPNHPIGRSILGTRETIAAMDRSAILSYRNRFYTPDNIVFAAAGQLNHDDLVRAVSEFWCTVNGTADRPADQVPQLVHGQALFEKDIEQVHLCLGTIGVPFESSDYYGFHLLNTLLGGGVSSRLFQSIREEKGLAYSVYSYPTNFKDTGLLTVYAGVSPDNTIQVIELIHSLIHDMQHNGIDARELTRAKEQLKAGLVFGLESSGSRMSRIGRAEISGRPYLTSEELVHKVEAVTLESVHEMLQPMFAPDCTTFAALGPIAKSGLESWKP
jgi:predicted Zn-dependent peptidase